MSSAQARVLHYKGYTIEGRMYILGLGENLISNTDISWLCVYCYLQKYFDEAVRVNEEKRSKFEALDEVEKEELRKKAQNLREYRLKRKIRLERRKVCIDC